MITEIHVVDTKTYLMYGVETYERNSNEIHPPFNNPCNRPKESTECFPSFCTQ